MILHALWAIMWQAQDILGRAYTPDLSPHLLCKGDSFIVLVRQLVRSGLKHKDKLDSFDFIISEEADEILGVERGFSSKSALPAERGRRLSVMNEELSKPVQVLLVLAKVSHTKVSQPSPARNVYLASFVLLMLELLGFFRSEDNRPYLLSKPRSPANHQDRPKGGLLTTSSESLRARSRVSAAVNPDPDYQKFAKEQFEFFQSEVVDEPICRGCGRSSDEVEELVKAGNRPLSFCSNWGVSKDEISD
ncbi:hypothetical protein JCM3765_005196 [Sporobolomyces pararoseus]